MQHSVDTLICDLGGVVVNVDFEPVMTDLGTRCGLRAAEVWRRVHSEGSSSFDSENGNHVGYNARGDKEQSKPMGDGWDWKPRLHLGAK